MLDAVLAPHASGGETRILVTGSDIPLGGTALTCVALLLHELATNAAKHGALSVPEGRLSVRLGMEGDTFVMTWLEENAPHAPPEDHKAGFRLNVGAGRAERLAGDAGPGLEKGSGVWVMPADYRASRDRWFRATPDCVAPRARCA